MKLLVSFTWIEYFIGSKKGIKVKDYIESNEPLYTASICLTEIKSKYLRKQKDPTERINLIIERSYIISLNEEIALLAADILNKNINFII